MSWCYTRLNLAPNGTFPDISERTTKSDQKTFLRVVIDLVEEATSEEANHLLSSLVPGYLPARSEVEYWSYCLDHCADHRSSDDQ